MPHAGDHVLQQPFPSPTIRFLRGVFFLGHPPATFMIAVVGTACFMIARKDAHLDVDVTFMFTSVFLVLYSIGAMNDYVDHAADRRAGRQEKPLIAGDISRNAALSLWTLAALLGFAASYCLRPAAAGLAIVLWLAGAAYNVWAKSTVLSWLPFVIFFPSLPIWAFVAAGRFTLSLLMAYPVISLLAVGLNISNTLPDLEGDAIAGVRGFTHMLGLTRALLLLWLLLAGSMALMALSSVMISHRLDMLLPGLAAGAVLLGAMMADWLLMRSRASLRRTFYLSAVCSGILGCTWIATLP
jgi:4-hydroxybenzoate polyprenyltransferase